MEILEFDKHLMDVFLYGHNNGYKVIENNSVYYDSITDQDSKVLIIQRRSDDKYFKIVYLTTNNEEYVNNFPLKAKEVTLKTKTINYYE